MPEPVKVAEPPANATPAPAAVVPPAAASVTPKSTVTPTPATPGVQTVPLPELLDERNKRQTLENDLKNLKAEMDALKKVAPQPAAPQQPINQYQEQMDKLWESDPRRAVQVEIMTAFGWYDGVMASLDAQEHQLTQKYPDYNTYRNEVRSYVRSLPIEQRAREGIVDLAYYAVKGQHMPNELATERQRWEAEFLEKIRRGEIISVPAGTVTTPPVLPQATVTDEEKRVAEAMGMTVEDYLKYKKVP